MQVTPPEFLRLAVDPDRLAVLGLAATGPLNIEEAAHRLSMTVGQVRRSVSRLVEAGLLDENLSLDRSCVARYRRLAAAGRAGLLRGAGGPVDGGVSGRSWAATSSEPG